MHRRFMATAALVGCLVATSAAPAAAQRAGWWGQPSVCTERVSLAADGAAADADSLAVGMSDGGQHVVFTSVAGNLVSGDDNRNRDVFVRDRVRGITYRVGGSPAAADDGAFGADEAFLSGDGSTVAFVALASRATLNAPWRCGAPGAIPRRPCVLTQRLDGFDLNVVDRATGATRSDGASRWPALSRDGFLAAFWSTSADLVTGDAGADADVFVADLGTGAVERISRGGPDEPDGPSGAVGVDGAEAVALSRDGRFVVFASRATNLVAPPADGESHVYVFDRQLGVTDRLDDGSLSGGQIVTSTLAGRQAISDDGRIVVFGAMVVPAAGGAPVQSLVLGDRGSDRFISLGAIADGRIVPAIGSVAVLSGDGRYVAYAAGSAAAAPGAGMPPADIYVHDRVEHLWRRISVAPDGKPADRPAGGTMHDDLSITADGRQVAWASAATNIVPDDVEGHADVFVTWPCDRTPGGEPTATPTRTASPSPVPSATPPPTAPARCICAEARRLLPPAILDAAAAHPDGVYGWRLGLNVARRVGPANPPRECLSVRNPNVPYHPMWNGPMYIVGCRQAGRP